MLTQVAISPFDIYCDCKGTVQTLNKGRGAGAGPDNTRAHMWAPFWASFCSNDFQAFKTKAHCSMTDVYRGETTLWEKHGNDAADEFAKKGGSLHGVGPEHFHLWRGLSELCREAAQWTGEVHALAGDGVVGRDHDHVGELWAARGEAEEAPPVPAAPLAPDPPAVYRRRPADGWDEYADVGYNFNGHPLLFARVSARDGREDDRALSFCCACGAYFTGFKPTRALLGPCLRENAGSGLQDQLRRLRSRQWPSYKAGVKDLVLEAPVGVPTEIRVRLAQAFTPEVLAQLDPAGPPGGLPPGPGPSRPGGPGGPSSASRGSAARSGAPGADPGAGSRACTLRAFGLTEADLPSVAELGARLCAKDADDGVSDASASEASDFGPA